MDELSPSTCEPSMYLHFLSLLLSHESHLTLVVKNTPADSSVLLI